MFYTAKEASGFNLIMPWSFGRALDQNSGMEGTTRKKPPREDRGSRDSQSLFLVGRERDQAEPLGE